MSDSGHSAVSSRSSSPARSVAVSDHDAADSGSELSAPASARSSVAPSERSNSPDEFDAVDNSADLDEEEHMRLNPELYGLRRSSRAVRTSKPIIESDSDDDVRASAAKRKRLAKSTSVKSSVRQSPSGDDLDSDSGSDSDFDRRKRKRLTKRSSPTFPSANADGEIRFSTRKAAKVVNYNEDEDDDEEDEVDENLTPNYWATEQKGPHIQLVLNYRVSEDEEEPIDRTTVEYYIQWQGEATYHATWETLATLKEKESTGLRKVDNFYANQVKYEQLILNDPDSNEDDKERLLMHREKIGSDIMESQKVDRIISSRQTDDGQEYLVKWKQTEYAHCTWESEDLVSKLALAEIDRYLDRSRQTVFVDKKERNPDSRSRMVPLREQPGYITYGTLRGFQLKGVNFLAYNWTINRNSILADEMGLGKTVQAVSFMSWLFSERKQEGPFIVVVPLSTISAWAETFDNWAPFLNYVVYHGSSESRRVIQEHELGLNGNIRFPIFNVLLTTWEMVNLDVEFLSQIRWELMVVDEAHKLKNRDALIYTNLLRLKTASRVLLTGTPVQNNLKELTALLDLIEPGITNIADDVDSLTHEEQAVELAELRTTITPFMLRRTKEVVEKDLPPKTERLIRMKLADAQLELYSMLLAKNFKELNEGLKGPKHSMANILMELRKASNHPFLIPAAQERYEIRNPSSDRLKSLVVTSGKMMLLDQLLSKLKKDGHRVLIFSQMVKMLDIIEEYLNLRGHQLQRLDGTVSADQRRKAMDHFNAPESQDFCFLLTTRAGGLGINLMTADTVIIFDSDWNPQADLQAMARAHRIGQTNPVNVYRLVSEDTIDEDVIQRATKKRFVEYIIMNRGGEEDDETAKASKLVNAPEDSRDIIQMLKKRSQNMFEQTDNQRRLEAMDIDAVLETAEIQKTEVQALEADGGADFLKSLDYVDVKLDMEWQEIIPKEALDAAEAERIQEEEEAVLAQIVGVTQKRKRNPPRIDGVEEAPKKPARRVLVRVSPDARASDPTRPLDLKESRSMYRALGKFGAFRDRTDDILKDAGLLGRDVDILLNMMDDIQDEAKRLTKIRDEELALAGSTNKKDVKTVLFDYGNFKQINAEVILDRPKQMRSLRKALDKLPSKDSFRIPEANSVSGWAAPWGAREDAMLLIGTDRHGFGSWTQIRDDPELDMADKMFLDENKAENKGDKKETVDSKKKPAASHLKARTLYLINLVKDREAGRPTTNRNGSHSIAMHHGKNSRQSSQTAVPKRKHDDHDDRHSKKMKPNGHSNGHALDGTRHTSSPKPRKDRHDSHTMKRPKLEGRDRHSSPLHGSKHSHDKIPRHHSDDKVQKSSQKSNGAGGDHKSSKPKISKEEEQRLLWESRLARTKENKEGFGMLCQLLQEVRPALRAVKRRSRYANTKKPRPLDDALYDIGEEIKVMSQPLDPKSDPKSADEEAKALQKRFWDFVADFYWRSQATTGLDLRRVYERKMPLNLDENGDLIRHIKH